MRRAVLASPDRTGKAFLPGSRAHFLYNLGLAGALVLTAPVWIPWMSLSAKRRRNFPERLGIRPGHIPLPAGKPRILIHAVSVGETLSAVPLVRALKGQLPSAELFFSTVTITGQQVAGKALAGLVEKTLFFPFDLPRISGRFLDRVGPDVVAILETEIWPNFLGECAERGIPVVILNGRLSERSFRGYGRFRSIFARVLACITVVAMQTEEDARRMIALGVDPAKVTVTGNMKFDVSISAAPGSPFLSWLKGEKDKGTVWIIAGSTHEGEEDAVLSAFSGARSVNRSVRLLLAPRHPERFDGKLREGRISHPGRKRRTPPRSSFWTRSGNCRPRTQQRTSLSWEEALPRRGGTTSLSPPFSGSLPSRARTRGISLKLLNYLPGEMR